MVLLWHKNIFVLMAIMFYGCKEGPVKKRRGLLRWGGVCWKVQQIQRPPHAAKALATPLVCAYVLFTWIFGFSASLQPSYSPLQRWVMGSMNAGLNVCIPGGPKAYITWITLAVYIIPVMISVCYGLISFKIWHNIRRRLCESNFREATQFRVNSVRLIFKA